MSLVVARVDRKYRGWLLGAIAALGAGAWLMLHSLQGAPGATSAPVPAGKDDWAGRVAPEFELNALDGRRVRLSDFRGHVVLVNFWATWCAPCRVEMPWLSEFDARYRAEGLTILGVSVDDGGQQRVASFVRERQVRYPILLKDDTVELRYGGVRFLPQSFFIGRDGKIIRRVYGIRTRADFEADIRGVLGLPPA